MICVYAPDETDFSTNGLGVVLPSACTVTETLNGEWELMLTHPLDEYGKWQRLVEGAILRAPVPASYTPQVKLISQGSSKEIYKVSTQRDPLRLRSGTGTNYKILAKYKKGTEVVLVAKTTSSWYEVICPDGKRGYMYASYLTYVRTESTPAKATGTVVESRPLRDQPFRIYRVVPELTQVSVYARHVFYDLLDNMLKKYEPSASDTGATVAQNISAKCQSEHEFTFYSDLDSTAEEVSFENINPVEALLGDGGLIENYGGELARDWYDVFLVKRVGSDTDMQIREGKNLLGISYDIDITDVVTRIMPTGEDKDGETLYLPELFLDSPYIDNYPHPKWIHLAVGDAKEVTEGDDKKTKAKCYVEMRKAAQDEFNNGCDLPTVTLTVDFVNLVETEEYRQYAFLRNLYIGDSVGVIARRVGVSVFMRMTQYTFDCLTGKYTSVTLGSVSDTIEGSLISARQLASGSITGSKLAFKSIGSGQIVNGAIGSLQIGLAAIKTAHIQDAAINNAKIGEAAIGTANIQNASITSAKIAEAAIESAHIGTAVIDTAKIKDAAITSAKIAEAAINKAHIGDAQINTAHIQDAAITHAKIDEAAIGTANIQNAAITSAQIADAAITNAKIDGAAIGTANIQDAAIVTAKILDGSITRAKIADLAVDSAKIDDLAVTTAKIAQAAITNAKIANAAIGTAQIALGAITAALIENGAVGTAQIADASITDAKIVELTANKITAGVLSVERLIIRGNEQSLVYAINNMGELVSTQVDTIDGYVLTERTITADKIVAHCITADEIAAKSITANEILAGTITGAEIAAATIEGANIKAGTLTTSLVSSDFGETLDLTSNTGINQRVSRIYADMADIEGQVIQQDTAPASPIEGTLWLDTSQTPPVLKRRSGAEWETVNEIDVGGRNLIQDSEEIVIEATSENDHSIALFSPLEQGQTYTFSVGEVELAEGSATGVTLAYDNTDIAVLAFSADKQSVTFTPRVSAENTWSLLVFAGIRGATGNVGITLRSAKLERGNIATDWTPAPEDDEEKLELKLTETRAQISTTADSIRQEVAANYAPASDMANVRQQLTTLSEQTDTSFSWTVTQLNALSDSLSETQLTEEQVEIVQTYMQLSGGGLLLGKTGNPVTLRILNDRVAFYMNDTEVAYLSNNKLYVTQAEILTKLQIGKFAYEPQTNGNLSVIYTG